MGQSLDHGLGVDRLVDWGEGRLVEVSPPEAGNTWAPEAIWDPEQDAYLVHWSSTLYDDAEHAGEGYNRIMCATTRDFREFSEPRVWIDRGWQTIDTTVIEHEGVYYRFLKDERSRTGDAPHCKSIFSETSTSLTATGLEAAGRRHRSRRDQPGRRSAGVQVEHRGQVVPLDRRVHPRPPVRPLRNNGPHHRHLDPPAKTTGCPRIPATASSCQ